MRNHKPKGGLFLVNKETKSVFSKPKTEKWKNLLLIKKVMHNKLHLWAARSSFFNFMHLASSQSFYMEHVICERADPRDGVELIF